MVKKGGQRSGRRTILERLCHAWLDEYPEKIYVTVSEHFDPEAFGWSHICLLYTSPSPRDCS